MADLLITAGQIYSPSEPFADALLISEGRIAWIGQSEAANVSSTVSRIDLPGALVTPGFVDAHVHATTAGLVLLALDLQFCRSKQELLDQLEQYARLNRGAPVIGHGWDDSRWNVQDLPSRAEIDRATYGSVVYLSRVDVHSALVSSALVATTPGIEQKSGWSDDGPVSAAAHGALRQIVMTDLTASRIQKAQRAFINSAFKQGVVSIHECGGPQISGEDDFLSLQVLARELNIDLVGYWGEFGEAGVDRARALRADGVGGDLFIDGSLGSHTAALIENYADRPSRGLHYLDEEMIFDHLRSCTAAGVQSGFHAIGDRALEWLTEAVRRFDGDAQFTRLRHRVEHAELLPGDVLDVWRGNGLVASVQPLFDRYWGTGMYRERLGSERAGRMNQFATMVSKGVTVAFGSDAPVTRSSPWEWIQASVWHSNQEQRLTSRAAFNAATRGGRRAAHQDDAGVIAVGARADIAVWQIEDLVVQTPDSRIAAWSTDARAGVPGLPQMQPEGSLPQTLLTVVGGQIVYQRDQ